jgi:hypothetical protein
VQLTSAEFALRSTCSARKMKGKKQTVDAADPAAANAGQDLRTRGWHRRFGQQFIALLYKNGECRGWHAVHRRYHIAFPDEGTSCIRCRCCIVHC